MKRIKLSLHMIALALMVGPASGQTPQVPSKPTPQVKPAATLAAQGAPKRAESAAACPAVPGSQHRLQSAASRSYVCGRGLLLCNSPGRVFFHPRLIRIKVKVTWQSL